MICIKKMSSSYIALVCHATSGKGVGHTGVGKYWISCHYHHHHSRATTLFETAYLTVTVYNSFQQNPSVITNVVFVLCVVDIYDLGLNVRMKFPRANALRSGFRLPTRANKKGKFDPERLSFFIVVTFFSIFAVIVIIELLYKDFEEE